MRKSDETLAIVAVLALLLVMRRPKALKGRLHLRKVWYIPVPGAVTPIPMWVGPDFKGEGFVEVPGMTLGFYRANEDGNEPEWGSGGYISNWREFWMTGYPDNAQRNEEPDDEE